LRRQRSADKGVEIARAALPATAIEENDDRRLGRVPRLINIELLSRPLAINETEVFLPCAVRFPEIDKSTGKKPRCAQISRIRLRLPEGLECMEAVFAMRTISLKPARP
jgi:hypothetical protein